MSRIAIVDYGVGNLKSVSNALKFVGCDSVITDDVQELERADGIILPGVGAFPDAAEKLRASGLDREILIQGEKKPVMGICLGMQLMLQRGTEIRPCEGLGVVQGICDRIPTTLKLPHIGWNSLSFPNSSPLFEGISSGAYVYFVHTFSAQETEQSQVIAVTDYGGSVTAAVQKGNFFGCQFHPEKSGEIGLQILKNFGGLNR